MGMILYLMIFLGYCDPEFTGSFKRSIRVVGELNTKAFAVSLAQNGSPCETFRVYGNGKVECKEVTIRNYGWCDYVFEPDYKLMPLAELKSFVMTNKHLPDIKSASDVSITGVQVYEMNKLLLKKIEELKLHVITKQEELNNLTKQARK